MASAFKNKRGAWRVTFTGPDKRRLTIHVGTAGGKRHAEDVRTHVEELLHAKVSNTSPDRRTSQWLAGANEALHAKLAAVGLCDSRASLSSRSVGAAFQAVIDRRTDLSRSGREKLKQARQRLIDRFGADRDLRTINVADAKDFGRWLMSSYATATASAHIRKIKSFFVDCVDRGLIDESPFAKMKGSSEHNAARMVYVSVDQIESVIDQTADAEWRLLIALARYAGVRVPSEVRGMKWTDVQWDAAKFIVRSQKTARVGKPTRLVPIFPELLPHFQAAFEAAEDGAVYVFPDIRRRSTNIRKPFLELIERAGVPVWGKLFQNLRSSCETDLCRRFPLHVACAWVGNTAAVANKHYLQVTDEHFADASKGVAKGTPKHAETEGNGMNQQTRKPLENQGFRADGMAPAGPELSHDSQENTEKDRRGYQKGHHADLPDEQRLNNAFHAIYQAILHPAPTRKDGGR